MTQRKKATESELKVMRAMGPLLARAFGKGPPVPLIELAHVMIKALEKMTPEMREAAEGAMKNKLVSKKNVAEVYWSAAVNAASPPL